MAMTSFGMKYRSSPQITPDEVRIEEIWLAVLEDPKEDPLISINGDNRCPQIYQAHRSFSYLFVVECVPIQNPEVPQSYDVRIVYSSRYIGADGDVQFGPGTGIPDPNPLMMPAKIEHSSHVQRKRFEMAYDENNSLSVPVMTTAGEELYLEDEVEYPVMAVTKNVVRVHPLFVTVRRIVNKDAVSIPGVPVTFQPGQLMARGFRISPKQTQVQQGRQGQIITKWEYYVFSFQLWICIDEDRGKLIGWDRRISNSGFLAFDKPSYIPGLGPQKRKLQAIQVGDPPTYPTSPVPLTSEGTVYDEFKRQTRTTPIDPNRLKEIRQEAQLTFRTVRRINFNGLLPFR